MAFEKRANRRQASLSDLWQIEQCTGSFAEVGTTIRWWLVRRLLWSITNCLRFSSKILCRGKCTFAAASWAPPHLSFKNLPRFLFCLAQAVQENTWLVLTREIWCRLFSWEVRLCTKIFSSSWRWRQSTAVAKCWVSSSFHCTPEIVCLWAFTLRLAEAGGTSGGGFCLPISRFLVEGFHKGVG